MKRSPRERFKRTWKHTLTERLMYFLLWSCAASSVFITGAIVFLLISESIPFFEQVSVRQFLTETQWTPLFEEAHFGIITLMAGTLVTTLIAIGVALPVGLTVALFLRNYSSRKLREILKPLLELLAAIPSVVYGYFALMVVTPFLQKILPGLQGFNMLSAGLVMGIMIIPMISSLSEDALSSVPQHLKEAAYGLGASRLRCALTVEVPTAFSGLTAAAVLAVSRAIGETMIVAIAAGMQAHLTWNPLQAASTMTAFIVQVSMGDLPHDSIGYQSIFVVGLSLFVMTLIFNLLGLAIRQKYQQRAS